jgi:ABC-type transporter Mla subunit MlaD
MSEERFQRIDRQLEFLSENQAQLTIALAKQDEQLTQLGDFIGRLARVLEEHVRQTHARFGQTDEQIKKLVQAQSQTDKRLKSLIAAIERRYANGRH